MTSGSVPSGSAPSGSDRITVTAAEVLVSSPGRNFVYRFADGLLDPGEAPGLGVDYDDAAGAAHPYEPAYLPVNRLKLDGSMHDW